MTQNSPRRTVWPIVAVLVLLPVLYVGSFGPTLWIAVNVTDGGDWHNTVYAPVSWTVQRSAIARNFIREYGNWWLSL